MIGGRGKAAGEGGEKGHSNSNFRNQNIVDEKTGVQKRRENRDGNQLCFIDRFRCWSKWPFPAYPHYHMAAFDKLDDACAALDPRTLKSQAIILSLMPLSWL